MNGDGMHKILQSCVLIKFIYKPQRNVINQFKLEHIWRKLDFKASKSSLVSFFQQVLKLQFGKIMYMYYSKPVLLTLFFFL